MCTLPVHPERSVGPVAERWASARLAVLAYLIGRDSELSTRESRKSVRVAVTWSQEASTFIAGFTRTSMNPAAIRLLGKDGIVWPAWPAGPFLPFLAARHVRRFFASLCKFGQRAVSREAPSFASCAARGAHSGDGRGRTVAWGIAEARFARTPTNRRCKAGTRGDSVTRAGAVPSSPGQLSYLKAGLVKYLWEIGVI